MAGKRSCGKKMILALIVLFTMCIGSFGYSSEDEGAVNLILKNNSSSTVEVELIDQYGGNFTASIDAGTSQNQAVKANSEIKVGGNTIHVATPSDEGAEIVISE